MRLSIPAFLLALAAAACAADGPSQPTSPAHRSSPLQRASSEPIFSTRQKPTPPAGRFIRRTSGHVEMDLDDSHYAVFWPDRDVPLTELGPPHMELWVGQNLIDTLFSLDMLHLVMDKLSGFPLPVAKIWVPLQLPENLRGKWWGKAADQFGKVFLVLSNLRVHKARITGNYRNTNPNFEVVENNQGGHLKQHDVKPEQKPTEKRRWWWPFGGKSKKDAAKEDQKPEQKRRWWWPFGGKKKSDAAESADKPKKKTWRWWWPFGHKETDEEKHQRLTQDEMKAHEAYLDDLRMHSDTARPLHETRTNPVYLAEDHVKVAIKGLNLYMTVDYTLAGLEGAARDSGLLLKGSALVRCTDSVFMMDVNASQDPETGRPQMETVGEPSLRFGKVEMRLDGLVIDGLANILSRLATSMFERQIGAVIGSELGRQMTNISLALFDTAEKSLSSSINRFLKIKGFPAPVYPRLLIREPRWRIEKNHLVVQTNLMALSPKCRADLESAAKRKNVKVSCDEHARRDREFLELLPVNEATFEFVNQRKKKVLWSDFVRQQLEEQVSHQRPNMDGTDL